MGIRVLRLSHTSGEWRIWGGVEVEVHATSTGAAIEFTRKVGRGSATFQIEFDEESLQLLSEALRRGDGPRGSSEKSRG